MPGDQGHSTAGNKRARRDGQDALEAASDGLQDDAEDEAGNGVAMAVSCNGSRVGVAWFDEGQVRDADRLVCLLFRPGSMVTT